eukprot:6202869-Pleurochrysis_carterae.AAC.3
MQVLLNTVDGRATAVVILLQVFTCYRYSILRTASKATCGRLHGCAHFSRVMYYPAAAIVQIIAFFVSLIKCHSDAVADLISRVSELRLELLY